MVMVGEDFPAKKLGGAAFFRRDSEGPMLRLYEMNLKISPNLPEVFTNVNASARFPLEHRSSLNGRAFKREEKHRNRDADVAHASRFSKRNFERRWIVFSLALPEKGFLWQGASTKEGCILCSSF